MVFTVIKGPCQDSISSSKPTTPDHIFWGDNNPSFSRRSSAKKQVLCPSQNNSKWPLIFLFRIELIDASTASSRLPWLGSYRAKAVEGRRCLGEDIGSGRLSYSSRLHVSAIKFALCSSIKMIWKRSRTLTTIPNQPRRSQPKF